VHRSILELQKQFLILMLCLLALVYPQHIAPGSTATSLCHVSCGTVWWHQPAQAIRSDLKQRFTSLGLDL
jgi:hypothetical protein